MKKFILILVCAFASLYIYAADNVQFTANVQSTTVVVGEPFQLQFVVNADGQNLKVAEFKGFEVLAGPYTSTSSSTQFINGKVSSSRQITYTYTISAVKEGKYTINPASITVDKQKYYSNAIDITVIAQDKSKPQGQQGGNSNQNYTSLSADNLFFRTQLSKVKVMEQEAVCVSYKIYSTLQLRGISSVNYPEIKNCFSQDYDMQNINSTIEQYNNKNYYVYELKKSLLFPQKSGQVAIEPADCEVVVDVPVQRRSRSIFDDFFGSYQSVNKSLKTKKAVIDVSALPTPVPASFCSVVGNLSVKQNVSATEVVADDPITITLTFSGFGNLKLLKNPELKFPADFETYEPKVSNNFKLTDRGMEGTKTVEFFVVPRHDGEFFIPATSLSFYDTNSKSYKTIEVGNINFKVAKNPNSTSSSQQVISRNVNNQVNVDDLATDIRYIKTDMGTLQLPNQFFAGSLLFWMCYIIPFVMVVALIFFFRKQARNNANVALMRNKKANKVAKKRLKVAYENMNKGEKDAFYDEVLRVMWGYISDKLSISLSDLNKENIEEQLRSSNVPEENINEFISLLHDCEFERYAPLPNTGAAMERIYSDTAKLISSLESTIKK
ncbi:MAG: BatD family protein [Candidatus Aphodosoma sp.]